MAGKNIQIAKCGSSDVSGWSIQGNTIQIELGRLNYESLERTAAKLRISLDVLIAEAILNLFQGDQGEI